MNRSPSDYLADLWTRSRSSSKRRGLIFQEGAFDDKINNPPSGCECCGITLRYVADHHLGVKRGPWPSLDRVNNDLGYVIGNVYVVCLTCQELKGSYIDPNVFLSIGRYMDRHIRPLNDDERAVAQAARELRIQKFYKELK